MIQKIKKLLRVNEFDIIWTFDPFRFQNLNLFQSPIMIYQPVDIHYTSLEKEIAKSAQIILTTCELIKDKLKKYNSNIYNIGHGISKKFFMKEISKKDTQRKIKTCIMGNFQRKIDYELLFKLVENHPEVEFHFIGPYDKSNLSKTSNYHQEINRLKSYSNSYFHGSLKQELLINKLFQMDVFLNFYREDENPASRVNPHKILEFLSTGKTVLSNYLDEYKENEDLLVMTKDKKDIPRLFTLLKIT